MSCAAEPRYRFAMGLVGRWPIEHLRDFETIVEGPRAMEPAEILAGQVRCHSVLPSGLQGEVGRLAVAIVDRDGWIVLRRLIGQANGSEVEAP